MTNIHFPHMRLNIKEYLESLSSLNYQQKVWVEGAVPNRYDSFDDAIAYIFDIAGLGDELETENRSSLGDYFYTFEEVQAVNDVVRTLNKVLDTEGLTLTDQEYITSPFWPNVLTTAQMAYQIIDANDKIFEPEYCL